MAGVASAAERARFHGGGGDERASVSGKSGKEEEVEGGGDGCCYYCRCVLMMPAGKDFDVVPKVSHRFLLPLSLPFVHRQQQNTSSSTNQLVTMKRWWRGVPYHPRPIFSTTHPSHQSSDPQSSLSLQQLAILETVHLPLSTNDSQKTHFLCIFVASYTAWVLFDVNGVRFL